MPIYEYNCAKCGTVEIKHKMNETITICPECGNAVKKRWTVPVVIYRGSGFYVNDSRREKDEKNIID